MACPNMTGCTLFPLFNTQAFLRVWQINYCEGEFTRCERHKLTDQGCVVSPTLLPNGKHLPVVK
jgi:hypothetical protein